MSHQCAVVVFFLFALRSFVLLVGVRFVDRLILVNLPGSILEIQNASTGHVTLTLLLRRLVVGEEWPVWSCDCLVY